MLDALLGRTELKETIAAVEDERDRLERRLEAETERRREAVRDRQAAEERVNHLEDRIAGLEGELERLRSDETELSFVGVETLDRRRVDRVLDRLLSIDAGPEGALTACLEDAIPEDLAALFGERTALLGRAAPCIVCADDAALVRVALAPPRPPEPFVSWGSAFDLERSWFLPTGRFTFALVRADQFAMGSYEGTERRHLESFDAEIQGRHSKGGFSQARFERRREEQIERHLDRCRATLSEREDEPLILVGDRRLIRELDVAPDRTAAVDASGGGVAALEDAFADFWRTRLYLL